MPTWMDFGLKNPPKSALGRLLGRLVAVLGRLGVLLRRLGRVLTRLGIQEKLQEFSERETMNFPWV